MAFDRNNPTDLAALVSELQNDPAGLGYATFVASGSPGSLLNLLQLNDPLGAVHTIETFTGEDFLDCLVQSATTASEYNAVVDGFTTASQVPARKMFIEQMLSYKASPIPKRFHARLQAMFTSGLAPTINGAYEPCRSCIWGRYSINS